jgi:hypothetical protein
VSDIGFTQTDRNSALLAKNNVMASNGSIKASSKTSGNQSSLLNTVVETREPASTKSGSDLSRSWNSNKLRGLSSAQVQEELSDYGDFDSDDERVLATIWDNANNLSSQPLAEAVLQNDTAPSMPRTLDPMPPTGSHPAASTSYQTHEMGDNSIETTSHYYRV